MIWLLVALTLFSSAVFSGAETVLLSFHRLRLRPVEAGGRGESWLDRLARDPSRMLSTVLIGNTISFVFLTSLLTLWAARRWGEVSIWGVMLVVTFLLLVVGEILPKSLARAHARTLRRHLVPMVGGAYFLLRPFVVLVSGTSTALLRGLRLSREGRGPRFTRQDLQIVLAESEELGGLATLQGRVLRRALEFADTPVEAAMVPRTRIVAVPAGTTLREVGRVMQEHRLSRLPVYGEDLDQVVGVVHRFDLFRAPSPELPVDGLLRPVHFVPESKHCHELLRELQARRQHLAIVLDEYGGTAGLVTVEDLVEELVGEIRDEHEPELVARRLDPFSLAVPGGTRLDELKEQTGVAIPEGDYETVAGYLLERLGRIPQVGEGVSHGPWRLEVLSATKRRIDQIVVRRERGAKKSG